PLTATDARNPDLFWALRGGGASFGVVTEIAVRVQPVGDVLVVELEWPSERAAAVLAAWQQHQASWPDELTLTLELGGTPAGTLSGEGLFLGRDEELRPLLAPLLAAAPPTRSTSAVMPWIDAAVQFSGESPLPFFKAKSDFTRTALPAEAVDIVVRFMARAPSAACALQFQQWGGAMSRVPADATAFPHRAGTLALMQYLAHWSSEADAPAHLRWIDEFYAAMRPYVSGGAYSNMPDVALPDWQHAYYGANFERLVAVKQQYDPGDVFRFAQSIPTR